MFFLLSLGQLYFYTKTDNQVTYRFQWSTSAFTGRGIRLGSGKTLSA